tara:strand:- start:873 stop:1544 length:672 start_codon:yes stop_codon:yes gene_type:complete
MSIIFQKTDDLYKCYQTIVNKDGLLDKRGYIIDTINNLSYIQIDLINQQKVIFHLETVHKKNENDKIHIIFLSDIRQMKKKKKLSEEQIFISNIANKKDSTILFIYYKQMNIANVYSQDNNAIKEFLDSLELRKFEKFYYKSVLYNITNHVLVPKHEIIEEDEINEVFNKYNIKNKKDLPKLFTSDPIAKFYGFNDGEVCKITRHNRNVGINNVYRLVVEKKI